MKYILYLLAIIYIIGGLYVLNIFFLNKETNIDEIKKSIVIIIPEDKLISYKNNPKGLFEESKNSGIGLGFFIDSKGIIQTVNHIIEDEKISYKILYKGIEYNSKVISRNKEKDLAQIQVITKSQVPFPVLKINNKNNLSIGDGLVSFGVNIQSLEIIFNTGFLINKNSKLANKTNLLEISNILKPGFSGGPIINSKGKVVGINYAIYKNKNYGIPSFQILECFSI